MIGSLVKKFQSQQTQPSPYDVAGGVSRASSPLQRASSTKVRIPEASLCVHSVASAVNLLLVVGCARPTNQCEITEACPNPTIWLCCDYPGPHRLLCIDRGNLQPFGKLEKHTRRPKTHTVTFYGSRVITTAHPQSPASCLLKNLSNDLAEVSTPENSRHSKQTVRLGMVPSLAAPWTATPAATNTTH